MKRTYIALLLAITLVGFGCTPRVEDAIEASRIEVDVYQVETRRFTPEYANFGTISFIRKADVHPATESEVTELLAEESDEISAGSPLARLDETQLRISLSQAEAEVASARSQLNLAGEQLTEGERQVEARLINVENARLDVAERERQLVREQQNLDDAARLFEADGIPESQFDDAQRSFESAEVALERAQNQLALQLIGLRDRDIISLGRLVPATDQDRLGVLIDINTATLQAQVAVAEARLGSALSEVDRVETLLEEMVIRSPISGTVATRYLELGERATPDNPLFTIIDSSQVYADLQVAESDIGRLAPGQTAAIYVESIDTQLSGTVARVSPIVNAETRSARARILIPNPDPRLRPGMFASVTVETAPPRAAVIVPADAILGRDSSEPYAYVVRAERLFRTGVTLGSTLEETVVVEDGLEPGEQIVLAPNPSLPDGAEVEIRR